MGGVALTPEIKNLIIKTWTNLKSDGNDPTATQIRKDVGKYIKGKEKQYGKLPKLRTFQEIIRNARKKLTNDKTIDEEWTMASLIEYDLPSDSIPCVIKAWRYAIANHEKFTVIQSKWVARLYRIYNNISELWYYSAWYSDIERTSILLVEDPVSNMTDGFNFLSAWETTTLFCTYHYYDKPLSDSIPYRIANAIKDGQIIEELLHYKNTKENACDIYSPDTFERVKNGNGKTNVINHELTELIRELPLLDTLSLEEGVKMVYLRLYGYLIRGSKWNDLSPKVAAGLIIDLRNWVISKSKDIASRVISVIMFDDNCPWPKEIYSKVGYESSNNNSENISVYDL
jgi:hypothetical protein